MTWYAVYETDNGRLHSVGTVVATPLPRNLSAMEIPAPLQPGDEWDPARRTITPRTPDRELLIQELTRAGAVTDATKTAIRTAWPAYEERVTRGR